MKERRNSRLSGFLTALLIPVMLVLALALGCLYLLQNNITDISKSVKAAIVGKEGETHVVNECVLKEVVTQSKLYTFEYPYNGYVGKIDEDGDKQYYVCYKGSVKAYIEADKIEFTVDDENSKITIKVPEVKVEDPIVEYGSMKFMYFEADENEKNLSQEAFDLANEDLKEQINNDKTFKEAANNSAETTVRALIDPWINQYSDKDYEIFIMPSANEK